MATNPEARADESFVGNIRAGDMPAHLSSLKTARLGAQAYDIHGAKLDPGYMLPLFIGRAELGAYDRIMMDRMKK
jgi:hypothetical protein